MGFYVEHQAVRTFANAIGSEGLGGDAGEASTYHQQWGKLPEAAQTGIFANFRGIASDVYSSADTALGKLKKVLNASGTELGKAADMYRDTDEETASKLDATY